MSDTRQYAHDLIDRLPDPQLSGLVQFLESFMDPALAALRDAPDDDEPETEEEKAGVARAEAWLEQNGGRGIPHDEAMRRLGLE